MSIQLCSNADTGVTYGPSWRPIFLQSVYIAQDFKNQRHKNWFNIKRSQQTSPS